MTAVCDTGPLNYLVLIGRINLLPALFGEIILPSAVLDELLDEGAPDVVGSWARRLPGWITLGNPKVLPTSGLGKGERAAIALAQELDARLLCDDGLARQAARRSGLTVTGTLGVLQLAHARSMLDIRGALDELERTNFHRGEGLFKSVVLQANSMYRIVQGEEL